ncbi:GNAT family N-acetyltransferase [Parabacteroides hominis]|jgi:ribosomal protein S18 acetylase RimI-like enzyme|uniref:GNAT family N-acetyltransferase n=1 Tax=Parabacteroides hominis TaxID=2763057 RepID=A0ABR7DMM0_9BACT|nr:GNAT family N-acetyltransferase [Parabacteroides hominis]MBC5632684.1 GNAT family N-acetyltransferase [Parabacteroides hominis]MBD9166989.1 GNAT family N-acetyltransferase [Parabacteroides johnsonii]
MNRIIIKMERLDLKDVLDFFILTTNDFPDFNDDHFLESRAKKISNLADFITCRTLSGNLIGMIAFYMNRPPLCYITHVSLLGGYKGQGLFKEMYDFLERKVSLNGYTLMKLEVLKSNISAINSYCNCGFKIIDNDSSERFFMVKEI